MPLLPCPRGKAPVAVPTWWYPHGRAHVGMRLWPCTCGHAPVAVHTWPCPRCRAHLAMTPWLCPRIQSPWLCAHPRPKAHSTVVLSTKLGLQSRRVFCAVTLIDTDVAAEASVHGRAQMGRKMRIRARHAGVDGDPAAEVTPSKPSNFIFVPARRLPLVLTLNFWEYPQVPKKALSDPTMFSWLPAPTLKSPMLSSTSALCAFRAHSR